MNNDGPSDYKHRVHYNVSEGSLCVNKLTETDSGIYFFDVIQNDFVSSKMSHILHVQGTFFPLIVCFFILKIHFVYQYLSNGSF